MAEQSTNISAMGVVRYSNEQAKRITMECIETALIQLLRQKEMEKITISEIVARAGVSRTAFYAHYQSKEDVLKSILGETVFRFSRLIPGNPRDEDFWLALFHAAKEISSSFSLLIKAGLGHLILHEITNRLLSDCPDDPILRWREILWSGAIYNVLLHWVEDGKKESPEKLAAYCEQIVNA